MEGMVRRVRVVLLAALLVACTDTSEQPPRPQRPSSGESGASTGPTETLPAPDDSIPASPERLASELEHTSAALFGAIDRWTEDPGLTTVPPRDVRLLALHQYRLTTVLTKDLGLLDATTPLLPRAVAGQVRANSIAGARIRTLVTPTRGDVTLRTQQPEPAGALLGYYEEAEERFGVDWEVLAALNFIESRFGRARSASSAGAQGPMQFIPATWDAYGMGGDIDDPHDAILGAANFLSTAGAPEKYRRPLYFYNHSWAYVDAVLLYARQIMRDPRNFLAYYNWPVVVATTEGDVFLTGPGSS
jgi:hypothetical protein